MVSAGLMTPSALAAYRNDAVYLRTSRYVPPRWEVVREAVQAVFDLLEREPEAAVRAVLLFPPPGSQRLCVIGNFVSTVDGVVSFEIAGKSGGGDISGFDGSGRFIMGLLRASADAVMVGSGTLHQTAPEHLFVAERVFPEARDLYARYRHEVLKKPAPPLQVVVSGGGKVDLRRAIFQTPGIRTLIVSTQAGSGLLAASGAGLLISTEVRTVDGPFLRRLTFSNFCTLSLAYRCFYMKAALRCSASSWRTAASTNFSSP
ncbi:MAG: dihydrofolate reductase family protein [Bryobacteraceae bacterium]|jgi:riboflavin biosynthesis pyrimidine reductase